MLWPMKSHLVSVLILFAAAAGAANPATILYDRAHGEIEPHPNMLAAASALGTEIRTATEPLTPAALDGVKLLYLRAPSAPFADGEKKTIVDFVRGGGSLLVVLDENQRQDLARVGANDFLMPFGLEFTGDTEYLHNCGGIAKSGVINAADREVPYSGGRAVKGGTPFAWRLDADGNPAEPFAAWHEHDGGGRILVMGEGMASLFMGTKEGIRLSGVPRDASRTTYWGKDSAIFMDEVFAWLLARRE